MAAEPPRRLTFEDFWRGEGPTTTGFRRLSPLADAALATTGQVRVDKPGRVHGEFLAIDSLADHPGIDSVVSSGPVMTGAPLPSVQELFVLGYGDRLTPPTAANLPNLKRLAVSRLDTTVLAGLPNVVDLICHDIDHIERLPEFNALRRLKVGREVFLHTSAELLTGLGELRWLHLIGWTGWRRLGGLANLVRLEAHGVSMSNLRGWRTLSGLRHLELAGRVGSLAGIEAFADLDTLSLGISDRVDLGPIMSLTGLRDVAIGGDAVAPATLSAVGHLPHLRRFYLLLGDIRSAGRLPTIGFLRGSSELEEVEIRNVHLEDASLDPLFELPRLRKVILTGQSGPNVDELRRRRPDIEIETHLTGEPEGRVHIGPVIVDRVPITGQWSIFQDLTGLLQAETNDDAERRIRSALRRADPELERRLTFDSESGGVGIYATTEPDIRLVAALIVKLAGPTGRL